MTSHAATIGHKRPLNQERLWERSLVPELRHLRGPSIQAGIEGNELMLTIAIRNTMLRKPASRQASHCTTHSLDVASNLKTRKSKNDS